MITDILSPPNSGLRLGQFASAHHMVRVSSPHDTTSSDAGSYKDNDISDDGEGMKIKLLPPPMVYSHTIMSN